MYRSRLPLRNTTGGEPGQWFDAQLIQIGDRTTVKVNGATVFDNVPQPDAVGGGLGFVAHWTNASIDDVSFTQIPVTRYRFTALPDLPNPVVLTSGVRAINDLGEAVGLSRSATGRVGRRGAVLWRNGRVIELGADADAGSAANDINNKSEIVGRQFRPGGLLLEGRPIAARLPRVVTAVRRTTLTSAGRSWESVALVEMERQRSCRNPMGR